eukprot:9358282-Pyramimonas_sp.AAC.2
MTPDSLLQKPGGVLPIGGLEIIGPSWEYASLVGTVGQARQYIVHYICGMVATPGRSWALKR